MFERNLKMQVASTAKCIFTDTVYAHKLQFTARCYVGFGKKRKMERNNQEIVKAMNKCLVSFKFRGSLD